MSENHQEAETVGIIRIVRVSGSVCEVQMESTGKLIFTDRQALEGDHRFSVWSIPDESWALSNDEWENVLKAYLPWKRQRVPGLKFNRGKRRDGGVHPFRRAVAKGTKRL